MPFWHVSASWLSNDAEPEEDLAEFDEEAE